MESRGEAFSHCYKLASILDLAENALHHIKIAFFNDYKWI